MRRWLRWRRSWRGAATPEACLVLTGDKALLRDEGQRGFAMMQRYGGSLISMGDPVGPPEVVRGLIWRFREEADRLGLRPVFYQVGDQHWQTYLDLGLTLVKLGEEAVVPIAGFQLEGKERAELRQAFNRGKRSGLSFRMLQPADVPAFLPRLEEISRRWLEDKAGEEKGFSLGSLDETYLSRFPVAIIEHEGTIVAFANLAVRARWRRAVGGPDAALLTKRPRAPWTTCSSNCSCGAPRRATSAFRWAWPPLSGLAQHRLAGRWNRFGNVVARHGERFYGFSGLRRFKAKFSPLWRPRYLVAPGGMHLPAALLDVTRLISLEPRRRHRD